MNNYNTTKNETYFYRVTEFVTTFGKDPGSNSSFEHNEDFTDKDLFLAKNKAMEYFENRLNYVEEGNYFLPFAAPQDFKIGENSTFSIWLKFVIKNADFEDEYIILGDDDETNLEGQEIEESIIEELSAQ